jgi:hypothetical protein
LDLFQQVSIYDNVMKSLVDVLIHLGLSKALFKAVDQNGNGELDLTDVMALAAIVSKLQSRFGAGATQNAQSVPHN